PARHHPGPRSPHIKKLRIPFPPRFIRASQRRKPFFAVLRISPHELEPDLFFRQRWGSHVDPEHRPEPQILADALVHHVFVQTPPPSVPPVRPHRTITASQHP